MNATPDQIPPDQSLSATPDQDAEFLIKMAIPYVREAARKKLGPIAFFVLLKILEWIVHKVIEAYSVAQRRANAPNRIAIVISPEMVSAETTVQTQLSKFR